MILEYVNPVGLSVISLILPLKRLGTEKDEISLILDKRFEETLHPCKFLGM